MRWLLAWLFPLWALLPRARQLGSVSFVEVAGVGWQCTIRPPHESSFGIAARAFRRRAVNAWSAQGGSLGSALRAAIGEAQANPTSGAGDGSNCVPKLGGEEFDREP